MRREDAAYPVGILLAGFPSEPLEKETIELWTDEIQRLEDPELAASVARRLVREEPRFPPLSEFLSRYGGARRRSQEADREIQARSRPALPVGSKTTQEVPTWVWVWSWARAQGDDRPFPQQSGFVDPIKMMSWTQYRELEDAWQAAGAPHRRLPTEVHSLT